VNKEFNCVLQKSCFDLGTLGVRPVAQGEGLGIRSEDLEGTQSGERGGKLVDTFVGIGEAGVESVGGHGGVVLRWRIERTSSILWTAYCKIARIFSL